MGKSALIVVAILGVWTCGVAQGLAADSRVVTIAVLPFENITKNAEINWLGHGFAETLATKLSNVSDIQLVERNQHLYHVLGHRSCNSAAWRFVREVVTVDV